MEGICLELAFANLSLIPEHRARGSLEHCECGPKKLRTKETKSSAQKTVPRSSISLSLSKDYTCGFMGMPRSPSWHIFPPAPTLPDLPSVPMEPSPSFLPSHCHSLLEGVPSPAFMPMALASGQFSQPTWLLQHSSICSSVGSSAAY